MNRKLAVVLALFACLVPLQATISGQASINVRADGSSTNGGGWVYGTTGTDMSLFANKNAAGCSSCQSATINISTTDAVANGSTTITSATANYSSAIVGNIVYFSGGSGSITAVRRQVSSFTNSTTIVLDASIASSTGMTMNIGGAVDSPATSLLFNRPGNRIWVKFGSYTTTATYTLNNSQNPSSTLPYNWISGYSSVYGDCTVSSCAGSRPTITLSTNSNLRCFAGDAGGWVIQNFICDANNLTGSIGIKSGAQNWVINNKVLNYADWCIDIGAGGDTTASDNECASGTSGTQGGIHLNARGSVLRNYIHGGSCLNACSGMINATGPEDTIEFNVLVGNDNGGHTVYGVDVNNGYHMNINYNTIDGGQDAINITDNSLLPSNIRGNLLTNQTRYGINSTNGTAYPAFQNYDGNCFYNITTANRNHLDDTGAAQAVYAAGAYTNVFDVQLTASPYTSGSVWTLNSTAGGGTAAKGTATPGTIGGVGSTGIGTGYMSCGAFQPQYGQGTAGGGGAFAYVQ